MVIVYAMIFIVFTISLYNRWDNKVAIWIINSANVNDIVMMSAFVSTFVENYFHYPYSVATIQFTIQDKM